MIVEKINPARTMVVPTRYGGITFQTVLPRTNQNREPFEILWTVPCKIVALATGNTVTRTAIRTIPPAIPTTPDRIDVNNTQIKTRIVKELVKPGCSA